MMQWITDPFWFDYQEFKCNLLASHCTFLHIVQSQQGSVKDLVNTLTGTVKVTKEFKVAVGL